MIYRSNLEIPDIQRYFRSVICQPRHWSMGHDAVSDPDFEPDCTFLTHDEAAILYACATQIGGHWLDIGARLGWSSMAIAKGGYSVDAVDPMLRVEKFRKQFDDNTHVASNCITARGWLIEEWFGLMPKSLRYRGAMVDGDHSPGSPLADARGALDVLEKTAVVIFHDFWGKPIRDGVTFLIDEGFKCRAYDTPNGMAVCWRGEFLPPEHIRTRP